VVVSEAHRCRPCGIDGCGGGKVSECLTTLPAARIHDAVRALLIETRVPAGPASSAGAASAAALPVPPAAGPDA
jgi:hypothetical protein